MKPTISQEWNPHSRKTSCLCYLTFSRHLSQIFRGKTHFAKDFSLKIFWRAENISGRYFCRWKTLPQLRFKNIKSLSQNTHLFLQNVKWSFQRKHTQDKYSQYLVPASTQQNKCSFHVNIKYCRFLSGSLLNSAGTFSVSTMWGHFRGSHTSAL